MMQGMTTLFAYIGPETILPATSVLAAVGGLLLASDGICSGSLRRDSGRCLASAAQKPPALLRRLETRALKFAPSRTHKQRKNSFFLPAAFMRLRDSLRSPVVHLSQSDRTWSGRAGAKDRRAYAPARRIAAPRANRQAGRLFPPGDLLSRRKRQWHGPLSQRGQTPAATVFLISRRNPQTYLPDVSLFRFEQKNAFVPPRAVNLRRGVPLWNLLTEAGISSTVIRCPGTFPPDEIRGRMPSGLGVPDCAAASRRPHFSLQRQASRPAKANTLSI